MSVGLDREGQCLLLHAAPFLGRRQLQCLFAHFRSVQAVWEADLPAWRAAGLSAAEARGLEGLRRRGTCSAAPRDLGRQRELLAAFDVRILALGEPDYPPLLATIPDPPPLLYVRGSAAALQHPQLAIVGSRKASPAGLDLAREIAGDLSRAGLTITSGLALGIDGAAHRGALEAAGVSVAVMATGVEEVYPRRHRGLAGELLEKGALVTEFAPLTPPVPGHFPARNRLISGLSLGVLVVEAARRSGSLITAASALDQGREVFAVPWFPRHAGGRGGLQLLRDGASLVETAEDILLALELWAGQQALPLGGASEAPEDPGCGGSDCRRVWALLGYEARDLATLAVSLSLPTDRLLAALTELELAGRVQQVGGGYLRTR